jgi:hypothetical protein
MISKNELKAIAELDLDPIKVKLMHDESGEGWTLEYANRIEVEYRRFLCLMKMFPNEPAAPLFDVDIFWHYHILDTMKYAADCEDVFGYFLHHFPYVGLRGEEDEAMHQRVGIRMRELYEETFQQAYPVLDQVTPTPGSDAVLASAWSYAVAEEAVGLGRQETAATARQTAYCLAPPKLAEVATARTAWSYQIAQEAVVEARKTAWSYAVGPLAVADVGRTGWSYAVGPLAAGAASKTALPQINRANASGAMNDAPTRLADSAPTADHATLRRLYFERPVLSAA